MTHATYGNKRSVRSPIQYRPPQTQKVAQREEEHPIREHVRKLCGTLNLSATFSEDAGALSTLKTQGLIAVQCVLSKDGRAIGIGHGSTIVSRINRANERTVYSCFNGALMSAINSACKTIDVLRLNAADVQAESDKAVLYGDAYRQRDTHGSEPATDKQKQYLLQLASINLGESDREQLAATVDDMTKEEASEAIQSLSR